MSEPFLGEIRIMSFNFPPKGWAFCNGQTLPINQNQALFSLMGTTYGGNGQTTFQLPNLQGRVPLHQGSGFTMGQRAGEEGHTVTISEMPQHIHTILVSNTVTTIGSPAGGYPAANANNPYNTVANSALNPAVAGVSGGSQAHENRPPFLVLTFCVALVGIFPSRN